MQVSHLKAWLEHCLAPALGFADAAAICLTTTTGIIAGTIYEHNAHLPLRYRQSHTPQGAVAICWPLLILPLPLTHHTWHSLPSCLA